MQYNISSYVAIIVKETFAVFVHSMQLNFVDAESSLYSIDTRDMNPTTQYNHHIAPTVAMKCGAEFCIIYPIAC